MSGEWFCYSCHTQRQKADKVKISKNAVRCRFCVAKRGRKFLGGPPDIPVQERPSIPDYIVDAYREACE